MKKKIVSCLLAMILLLTTSSVTTIFAIGEETTTFTLSSETAYSGDTIDITIRMENNPGIASIKLKVNFDEDLTLNSVTYNPELGGTSQPPQKFTSPITLNWYNGAENTNGDMTFATLNFTVSENASAGTHAIAIDCSKYEENIDGTYNSDDIYNIDEDNIDFKIVNGGIVVQTKMVPVTGLALDKTTTTVETDDETLTLTPIFSPGNATNKNLTWTSSDNEIATVADGVVTLIKKGVVTITATTEDGGYTASCVVTINCSHKNIKHYPAESSTCIKQGHGAYDVCEECGEIINGSDAQLPLAPHTFVEKDDAQYLKSAATCNSQAVYYNSCSICGKKSEETFECGEFDSSNHVGGTYKANQKEATCYEEGYTGDICCSGCNAVITEGSVIEKNAHNPASVWSTDENYHWKDCQTVGCGNIIDKAAHSGGEATCTKKAICSVCGVEYGAVNEDNHKHTEIRNKKAATEDEAGYTGDIYCTDCNKVIQAGTVIPKLDHIHNMSAVLAKEATCTANGNTAYWHCSKCGKYYSDAEGTIEISLADTVIPMKAHSYTVLQKDETCHWYKCEHCDAVTEKEAHSGGTADCTHTAVCSVCGAAYGGFGAHQYVEKADAQYLKSAATCVSKAVYYKSCSVCGEKSTETFSYGKVNPENHTGGTYVKNQKEATCYEEGYTGDICCSDCKAVITAGTVIEINAHNPASVWSTDENYHWKECQTVGCGNIIDKAEHTGGEATCTKRAICEVCGVEYGTINADNHKNTEIRNAIDATCMVDGYTGDVYCKDCGAKITDGTVIPAVGHKLNKIEAKDATHEADGNIEYYVCSVCGKLFRDAEAAEEIALEDTVIAKGEHDYGDSYKSDAENHWKECACGNIIDKDVHTFGEWTVIKSATETEKGIKERACSICGYKETEDVPVIFVEDNTDNNVIDNPTDEPTLPENPSESATSNGQEDTTIPNTGNADGVVLWSCLMLITAASVTSYEVLKKKKRIK